MPVSKVAIRYAHSFLDTSLEKNILERVNSDFEIVYDSFKKSPELIRAIKSPIIKSEVKLSILTEIFGNKISADSMSFTRFIISKGRQNILLEIIEKFFELNNTRQGIIKVNVITSTTFTDDQKKQLQSKFEAYLNKKLLINYSVDEKILGGFIAKIGDTVYNASMIHQLGLLKKQFLLGSAALN
jgi:F-type H+-transporting ATPase subunit delta